MKLDLIELKEEDKIKISMQYPKLKMKNAIDKCFLRKEVQERLRLASTYLPDGYSFLILDAYRPFKLQEELYYTYYEKIVKEFNLNSLSKDKKDEVISKYVSIPIKDRLHAPLHTTGGAIDLTLLYNGKTVNMGAEFDEFTKRSNTNYYEGKNELLNNNRKILYNAMIKAGFVNLESEFWHFDYGDSNWAKLKNEDIKYYGIF